MRRPLALALLALSACSGGSGGSSRPDGSFTLGATSAYFPVRRGAPLPPSVSIPITVTGRDVRYVGAAYRDGQAPASWLGIDLRGAGTQELVLSVLSPDLAPGLHTATFAVGTADASGAVLASRDVTVTCRVTAFSVAPATVVLGGLDGRGPPTAAIAVSFDDGDGPHPIAVVPETDGGGPWLSATGATQTVPGATAPLTLGGARTGVAPGTYSGRATVTVAGRDGNVSETVAVTFNVEASRIVVGAEGVGFSVSPSRSILSREVEILSSVGRTDVRWEASSDSAWLAVTASGTTGGKLLLSADPAGLGAGQTHFATVTVTSPDADVENSQTIRVGLHVLDADPPAATGVVAAGHHLAASPVEPVVFVSAGGTGVVAYDVYGGAVVRSFPSVVGRAFALATSGDGRRLFVQDAGATARVVELDAETGAVVREFPTPAVAGTNTNGGGLAYVRPDGRPLLVTPSSRVFDLTTGAELATRFPDAAATKGLTATPDGSYVATSAADVHRLTWTALSGGPLRVTRVLDLYTGGAEGQACLSPDRTRLFVANGFPYAFVEYSLETQRRVQELPGTAYPIAIVCAWNGLVIGGASAGYEPIDVFVYGPTGVQLAKFNSTTVTMYRSLRERGLAVSADGTRLVALVANQYAAGGNEIRLHPLPAP